MIESKTTEQLFALVRSAIWNDECPLELFTNEVDWQSIISMANVQTLTAIVFDAFERLNSALKAELVPISVKLLLKWYAITVKVEAQNKAQNNDLLSLEACCHDAGIKTLLLKGQGCASLYPRPEHRHCGDIDLFVGLEQYDAMKELLRVKGIELEKETRKDLHFMWNRTPVECHKIAVHYYHPSINKPLQRINRAEEWHDLASFEVNGVNVSLFNPTYNAFFIFMHIHHHFVQTGVGLRQVCDWTLHLKSNEDSIDWNRLHEYVKSVRVMKAWNAFYGFAKSYLDLHLNDEPLWMRTYSIADVEFVKRDIMQVGNFGKTSESMQHRSFEKGVFGNMYSFYFLFKRLCRVFKYGPEEILAYPVWKILAKMGVVQF